MAPKKIARNGYWYFMADWKKKQESRGKTFPGGFKDVQGDPDCSWEWQNLPDNEKERYLNLGRNKRGTVEKLTGRGESIAMAQARLRKAEQFQEEMKEEIYNILEMANGCRKSAVPDLKFFLVHVNYFYSKDRLDSSTDYIPAEMAIGEFSLGQGLSRFYHQIINVDVELGYARETMEHSDNTHKLTPDQKDGEKDYRKISGRVLDFMQPLKDSAGKFPVVYTREKHFTVVSCFLDRIATAAGIDEEDLKVYSLEFLFGRMMAMSSTNLDPKLHPVLLAETELSKDAFAYTPNIECDFHMKIEGVSIHCSLSIIRQWCYTICDYCCGAFNVKMISNIHCPISSDMEALATSVAALNIEKVLKPGTSKSMTGVSEAYRLQRAGRTAKEEEERRRAGQDKPLIIVDHGKLQTAKSEDTRDDTKFSMKALRAPRKPIGIAPDVSGPTYASIATSRAT